MKTVLAEQPARGEFRLTDKLEGFLLTRSETPILAIDLDMIDESIKYRLRTSRTGTPGPVVLAGPTCDSADILYEKSDYHLPVDLQCGDRVEILNTGSYCSSYASVSFSGFPPLRTVCL